MSTLLIHLDGPDKEKRPALNTQTDYIPALLIRFCSHTLYLSLNLSLLEDAKNECRGEKSPICNKCCQFKLRSGRVSLYLC